MTAEETALYCELAPPLAHDNPRRGPRLLATGLELASMANDIFLGDLDQLPAMEPMISYWIGAHRRWQGWQGQTSTA
jgi:hypothetical protein